MTVLQGIDIGGTAVKLGIFTESGRILARRTFDLDTGRGFERFVENLAIEARAMWAAAARPDAVGVCAPGFIDPEHGRVVDGGANVPVLRANSLAASLRAALDLPVSIANDGVSATIGELRFGAGRRFSRFALITIGTGVGGAVALDGTVITGRRGEPPEFGAMTLEVGDVPGSGCETLETLACAQAFLDAYRCHSADNPPTDLPDLFRRLPTDAAARAAVDTVAVRIAQALSILVNVLHLEACLIGGGISAAGEDLLGPVRDAMPRFTWPLLMQNVQLLRAELGNDAGFLGAAALAGDAAATTPSVGR